MTQADTPAGILIKRVFGASPDKVWRFWTSESGLEAWWGPVGFESRVSTLDVRTGGGFDIVMRATAPEQVAYLNEHVTALSNGATSTTVSSTTCSR